LLNHFILLKIVKSRRSIWYQT